LRAIVASRTLQIDSTRYRSVGRWRQARADAMATQIAAAAGADASLALGY
jgi:hypothetical protein